MNLQTEIREPAVAGSFYPDDSAELDSAVQAYLNNCDVKATDKQPLAMIVPHAGYMYSAPIAASAYKQLIPFAEQISKVVLLGPSHRTPLLGIATSSLNAFQTPLGIIPLDKKTIEQLNQFPYVQTYDEAHNQEHSLEVQLPFLQKILTNFTLVPLVIGQIDDQQVSDVIESLWQDEHTLILISSDLSHYLDYDKAKRCDQATCQSIEAFNPQNIHYEQACGRSGIAGMLLSAKKHHLQIQTLDLRNSGDTAGTRDRVVGYGAWTFFSE
ncbi:MAG: AmmeMemoRadiSam system protein B [gamma proteobacterium symbiont of Bathyaustriella thionipta]|nr:AmmeMemoRadiSam system protein B [gamma proteobacterium symbiont of Bathyaustriella thionipta]MCU7950200.1 AmmeMemoRadiSam system protein B [gamma proteobacterium symbiont of Bathyaustriella thionipta]MCU7953795.1 AmmeMemoRadiSam system protein B [gamma proteobacterium symbiont of Bathyaustriella thionipta]MCU7956742.1 AmmeMemoRadiSam system protein B [gamma proteobacterium symbiont of Bathyaustriella thionipta]MCU7968936.1 AmmeMemoRadiSam system protein B [gamma proteobacterium symbiont of 